MNSFVMFLFLLYGVDCSQAKGWQCNVAETDKVVIASICKPNAGMTQIYRPWPTVEVKYKGKLVQLETVSRCWSA